MQAPSARYIGRGGTGNILPSQSVSPNRATYTSRSRPGAPPPMHSTGHGRARQLPQWRATDAAAMLDEQLLTLH
ncbi:hypothetical protein FIBSPDRAFT_861047 [Athelia psychrophila]|uniref:Uncharacterized protein n=1 Tax=Athelia psychrophila TaxID=1759441 RepID=A0A166JIY7_9AGAM|nr:hypothetical protein FIBSPDRAFT_861047 [Fibularhizoctonia sp. CBS 109695]